MKVRVIIGPNGSGKTTFFRVLKDDLKLTVGTFINADEIEKALNSKRSYSFKTKNFKINERSFIVFLKNHLLSEKYGSKNSLSYISVKENKIVLKKGRVNSYMCAAIADYLREECLMHEEKFTFESVFSDKRKLTFIKNLKKKGYKIYLYVVSTINPSINVSRVQKRVKEHGHKVSEEKIISRFYKSLMNIKKAIPLSYRTFIIDNSQEFNPVLVIELQKGKVLFLNKEYQPNWVKKLV